MHTLALFRSLRSQVSSSRSRILTAKPGWVISEPSCRRHCVAWAFSKYNPEGSDDRIGPINLPPTSPDCAHLYSFVFMCHVLSCIIRLSLHLVVLQISADFSLSPEPCNSSSAKAKEMPRRLDSAHSCRFCSTISDSALFRQRPYLGMSLVVRVCDSMSKKRTR